ncbi:uncharacterized protein LOC136089618 [Hydra vulgaris]|uniref:Uncharacterized protein LOC136089618 n=1 Tax=Hydra vulgaris TaxID=6087 RepID=A0ABM4DBJ4_HYDVU
MKPVRKRMCRRLRRYLGIIPCGSFLLYKKLTKPSGSPLPSLNLNLFIAKRILTAIQSYPNNWQVSISRDYKISDDLTDCFDGEKIETFEDNEDSNDNEDNEDSNGMETVSLSASNCGQVLLDIGNLLSEIPSQSEIEKYVTNDHVDFPNILPKDINNQAFPQTILNFKNFNGEVHKRDWLVWSQHKQALFCFPCRLFSGNISKSSVTERNLSSRSVLASPDGYTATDKWRKLCNRIPEHERSNVHRDCYLAWRELERRFLFGKGIETYLESSIKLQSTKWSNILKRILDVFLFLGERGLAFRESSQRIGDVYNGNFLGFIELLSHWDPILKEHVLSVEESQRKECSDLVRQHILQEKRSAKYFAIMVDATLDSSHTEQTTFILRYEILKDSQNEIVERFLTYVDCNNKTGDEISNGSGNIST